LAARKHLASTKEPQTVKKLLLAALLLISASSYAQTSTSYAPTSTSDIDALMKANPSPAQILAAPPVGTNDSLCLQQCNTLSLRVFLDASGVAESYEALDNPAGNSQCVTECGDAAWCPFLDDDDYQLLGNNSDHYCWGQLRLDRGTVVYEYCSAVYMAQHSNRYCQGPGMGQPDPGNGGEP
jgi:hypothetical protein